LSWERLGKTQCFWGEGRGDKEGNTFKTHFWGLLKGKGAPKMKKKGRRKEVRGESDGTVEVIDERKKQTEEGEKDIKLAKK